MNDYINQMNENAKLMENFNKQLRDSAVKHIAEKEKLNPSVKAPYIMKFQDECDYFS